MSQVRVKDYTGKTIHKKKRGFTTKKKLWNGKGTFSIKPMQNMGYAVSGFCRFVF